MVFLNLSWARVLLDLYFDRTFNQQVKKTKAKPLSCPSVITLRLLRTFAGVLPCPLGKNSYARYFKGKHSKLYIVGKVNKCRFWKNMNCRFPQFCERKLQK